MFCSPTRSFQPHRLTRPAHLLPEPQSISKPVVQVPPVPLRIPHPVLPLQSAQSNPRRGTPEHTLLFPSGHIRRLSTMVVTMPALTLSRLLWTDSPKIPESPSVKP